MEVVSSLLRTGGGMVGTESAAGVAGSVPLFPQEVSVKVRINPKVIKTLCWFLLSIGTVYYITGIKEFVCSRIR